MYLLIYYLIPETTDYYLLPNCIVDEYKHHLDVISSIVINGGDVTEEQYASFTIVDTQVQQWKEYLVKQSSITNTHIDGVFTINYIV